MATSALAHALGSDQFKKTYIDTGNNEYYLEQIYQTHQTCMRNLPSECHCYGSLSCIRASNILIPSIFSCDGAAL